VTEFPPAEQPVSFRDPPVTEVAFAIQFGADVVDLELLGDIAAAVRDEFPARSTQPALAPIAEDFGLLPPAPTVILQMGPQLPRSWFSSSDGTRLIQVQADRVAYNWRQADPSLPYPRYGTLRQELIEKVLPLISDDEGSGALPPINFVELTYINELLWPESEPRGQRPRLGRFIRSLQPFGGEFLEEPEDARLQARWRIAGDDGAPRGRLYASIEPAFRSDQRPVYYLTLTARLRATNPDALGTVALLDEAHVWIVKGFADLTSDKMQDIWERDEKRGT
jgi:uncharacterized protein (TIGR04255 family)